VAGIRKLVRTEGYDSNKKSSSSAIAVARPFGEIVISIQIKSMG
jgi:hypothetical protein